ncbi:MAG: ABC transporter ATP-binding protein, partial [Candidatus Doudnabacteria bacterium]
TVLLVSHDRALLDAVAQRTLAVEDGTIRSYDGGWADYVRRRDELAAPPAPALEPTTPRPRPKAAAPKPAGPSELEQIESQIAAREQAVAELERRLAQDWADADALAAHRTARDELQTLLARWEQLFDQAQA